MNRKSKLFVSLLSAFLVGATPILSSCDDEVETQEIGVTDCSVKLSVSTLDLCIGDSYLLKANISGGNADTTLQFKSLNESVVSINEDGLITTHKPGKTEIRAIYGNALAKCEVNVSLKDNVPTIFLPNVVSSMVKIDLKTRIDVTPAINFNNAVYEFSPNYEVSDESIGKVEDNTFIPLKNGRVFVTVSGAFFGKTAIPYTLQIDVQDNVVIFMKEADGVELSNVHLFTNKGLGDKLYKTEFSAEFGVYINDKLVSSPDLTVEFVDDDNIFNYEEATHKVSSKNNSGEAHFSVTFRDESANVFVKTFKVFNDKTILEYEGDVIETDSFGTTLPCEDIFQDFKDDQVLVSASTLDQKTTFEVKDNKVIGLPTKIIDSNPENQKFIVYNSSVGYIVNLKVYTKIIQTAEDLDVFNMKETTSIIDGYYILKNDIDGGEYPVQSHARTAGAAYNFYGDCGFIGIFEGGGHVIKNISVGEGGIFGLLSKGSVVRNVAFVDNKFRVKSGEDDTPLLATYCNGCIMNNVYVSNNYIHGSNNAALIACNIMNNCSVSNCLFELGDDFVPKTDAGNGNYGVLASMYGERNTLPNGSQHLFTNTYVVSKFPLVHNNGSTKYVVDSDDRFKETNTEFGYHILLNIVHFYDTEEMKNSGSSFDLFSKDYWTVVDNVLTWKGLGGAE